MAALPDGQHCAEPRCALSRSGNAAHRYVLAAPPRHDATARFSWLGLVLRLYRFGVDDGFQVRGARRWPIRQRPRLALGIEGTEASDLGDVLTEAVAEFLHCLVGLAADAALDHLYDHHYQQHELGQLPYKEKHQHPDRSKGQRLALACAVRKVHQLSPWLFLEA